MEFLDGETLRDRIARGPIPPEEAISIAIQICRALESAHAAGIIHRDIKPANIFLTRSGVAKVLDFGVAKRVGFDLVREGGKGSPANMTTLDRTLTMTGAKVGTVAYMSPEQTRGEAVDSRTDLFSMGTVAFEMVTGTRPFGGETLAEVFHAIQNQPMPPAEKLSARIPQALYRIVGKALEKNRGERYQQAEDLRVELELLRARLEDSGKRTSLMVAAALGFVLLAGIGVWKWNHRVTGVGAIRSLAVLPLANLTGDPVQEYFADGMTNALITNLTKVGSLRVISRGSAMTYKGSKKPVGEIARDLNVDAVVEGTVERSGNRVRISAELVDAARGANLWAQNYDRDVQDVLQLQSEVAWEVVKQVQAQLSPEEKLRVTRYSHCTPNAYDLFQQGMGYWYKGTFEGYEESKDYFDRAVQADPNCAEAHWGVGTYYAIEADEAMLPTSEAMTAAQKEYQRAAEIDPDSGLAYLGLGYVEFAYNWNWAEAERKMTKALDLNPGFADSYREYAVYLRTMGRFDEAIMALRKAHDLDPLIVSLITSTGWTYYYARRWDEAIEAFKKTLKMNPQSLGAHEGLAKCYLQRGMSNQAIDELKLELHEAGADEDAKLLENAYRGGDPQEALQALYRARLEQLLDASTQTYVSPLALANLYSLLGKKNEAFHWLEKAYQEHTMKLTDLKSDPDFDNLHGDPRFDSLAKRIGLP